MSGNYTIHLTPEIEAILAQDPLLLVNSLTHQVVTPCHHLHARAKSQQDQPNA